MKEIIRFLFIKINSLYKFNKRKNDRYFNELHYLTCKNFQRRVFKEQISRCTGKLSRTTALIQFCIEILKEPDPVTYLQVCSSRLTERNV